jgi:hypothetical protein
MSPNVRRRISYLAGALALLFGSTVAASASEAAARQAQGRATDVGSAVLVARQEGTPPTYGITSTSVLTVPAFTFQASDDSVQGHFAPNYYNRYSPSGAEVEAAVSLPAGALITSIELEGCDTDPAGSVVYILFTTDSSGAFTTLSSLGDTGTGATPGCGVFPLALSSPHTVDNVNNTYYVAVRSGTTSATGYTAMRVYYNLQVSPAPGTATFDDVPTSDFAFQFIEAFNAAGITVGCNVSPPQFCPDRNVTRREMAVFFAKALGLHFAP